VAIPYIEADLFPSPRRLAWQFDAVLIGGICLALVFGVAAIGAVQPWAEFILRSCSVVLFLIWAVAQLIRGRLSIVSSPVYAPALAFAGLVVAQMVFGVTAYRHDTLVELLNYISYGLLAFVMLQSLGGGYAGKWLVLGSSGFGLAVSVFALLQYLASNGKVYWSVQVPADAPFFGPYVNHNHYAGLMEMLIAFPLVFALQSQVSIAIRWFLGFSAIIMAVSVVESGSRGGTIALVCQIVVLMVIGHFTKMKRGAVASLLVMLVAMAILLAVVADSAVVARISTLQEPGRSDVTGWRMHLNHDSLAMLRARPILGWGLGAFPTVYPQFRSFYDDAPIHDAHNDYMQLLAETGVAGGLITAWFLVVLLREGWRNLELSQSMWDKGITTAAIVSVSGILVHSASDFNLHIPANAAIFFVMCAIVAAPVFGRAAQPHGESQRNGSGRMPADLAYVEPLEGVAEPPPRLRVVVRRR
jgi:O-antigen ligase